MPVVISLPLILAEQVGVTCPYLPCYYSALLNLRTQLATSSNSHKNANVDLQKIASPLSSPAGEPSSLSSTPWLLSGPCRSSSQTLKYIHPPLHPPSPPAHP